MPGESTYIDVFDQPQGGSGVDTGSPQLATHRAVDAADIERTGSVESSHDQGQLCRIEQSRHVVDHAPRTVDPQRLEGA